MRINYYHFPEGMTPRERFAAYVEVFGEDVNDWRGKPIVTENTADEVIERHFPAEIEACTVTEAKKFLKLYGGNAYTEHIERDGGLFETTPIILKGNNSRFKYNRHL